MKMQLMEMMNSMMPFMKPLVYIGGALLVLGALAALIGLISGGGGGLARTAAYGLIALGVFFLGCQVAGMVLGATPSINFGNPAEFEFDLYPFWMIGGIMLIIGLAIRALNKVASWRTRSAGT